MKSEFKLMVFFNAAFAAFYLLWNWAEYSALNSYGYQMAVKAYFPWNIQFSVQNPNLPTLDIDNNFGLFTLLLVIFVNLYLAYRLQSDKTKQNPSQNVPAP